LFATPGEGAPVKAAAAKTTAGAQEGNGIVPDGIGFADQAGFWVHTRMALTGLVGQTTSQAPQPVHLSLTTG
jgi:hypothetical protein